MLHPDRISQTQGTIQLSCLLIMIEISLTKRYHRHNVRQQNLNRAEVSERLTVISQTVLTIATVLPKWKLASARIPTVLAESKLSLSICFRTCFQTEGLISAMKALFVSQPKKKLKWLGSTNYTLIKDLILIQKSTTVPPRLQNLVVECAISETGFCSGRVLKRLFRNTGRYSSQKLLW